MLRKVFNYDNMNESQIGEKTNMNVYTNNISACGCLLYKVVDNNIKLLLIQYDDVNWPRLDDFGGQIDLTDNTIDECINRELLEETNNVLNLSMFNDKLCFYNQKSKYYFYLIKTSSEFLEDTTIFGDRELADNIGREINWYNYNDVKDKLAYRLLCCDKLIDYLNKIN